MTVKDFRDYLAALPDDMLLVETRYSDFGPMTFETWEVVTGVRKVSGVHGWLMRSHPKMSPQEKMEEITCLHYKGN